MNYNFYCQIPNNQGGTRWGLVGVCHRISSPRGGGLVTMTVTNPHLAPPMPVWGVVGHNIDRCITENRVGNPLLTPYRTSD